MFSDLAPDYDRANAWLSAGVHRYWRRRLVASLTPGSRARVLDLATGTGDVALALRARIGTAAEIVGADFAEPMLEIARRKAAGDRVTFCAADAHSLPFESESFDAVTLAFGLRNFEEPARALSEVRRVLRPGGRLLVLEFGRSPGGLGRVVEVLLAVWLPWLGGRITGHRRAYRYLALSSAGFPSGSDLLGHWLTSERGWAEANASRLFPGNVYLYRAVKV
jgi:demethylmenaquinone methyltransferase/2-methoxy-6-polyprenyl-1,4-benzoquinol methylase